jgi:hypothetical protein
MHASVPIHPSWFALLAATALVVACDSSPSGPAEDPIFLLVIQPSSATLLSGGQVQLKVTAKGAEDRVRSNADVHWSSTDDRVATVTSSGVVNATNRGTAQITALWEGHRAYAAVRVLDPDFRPCPNFAVAASGPSYDKALPCIPEPSGGGKR